MLGLSQRDAELVLPMFGLTTLNQMINAHKALCAPVVVGMVLATGQQDSVRACAYLAMHGCYGACWCLKYAYFPDWGFEIVLPLPVWLLCFAFAAAHWVTAWIVVNNTAPLQPLVVCAALCSYIFGMFFMYVADAQKYFVLKERRRLMDPASQKTGPGLITDRVLTHSRNPNYLGEILIYSGFCLLSGSLVPWIICCLFWCGLFLPNMLAKEASLSRYPTFARYKQCTGLLVPWPPALLRVPPKKQS